MPGFLHSPLGLPNDRGRECHDGVPTGTCVSGPLSLTLSSNRKTSPLGSFPLGRSTVPPFDVSPLSIFFKGLRHLFMCLRSSSGDSTHMCPVWVSSWSTFFPSFGCEFRVRLGTHRLHALSWFRRTVFETFIFTLILVSGASRSTSNTFRLTQLTDDRGLSRERPPGVCDKLGPIQIL